jgi:hypothetical protein
MRGTKVEERECKVVAEGRSGSIPGWSHSGQCRLYYRDFVLKAALLPSGDESTRLAVLAGGKVFVCPDMLDSDKIDPFKIQSSQLYEIVKIRPGANGTWAFFAAP